MATDGEADDWDDLVDAIDQSSARRRLAFTRDSVAALAAAATVVTPDPKRLRLEQHNRSTTTDYRQSQREWITKKCAGPSQHRATSSRRKRLSQPPPKPVLQLNECVAAAAATTATSDAGATSYDDDLAGSLADFPLGDVVTRPISTTNVQISVVETQSESQFVIPESDQISPSPVMPRPPSTDSSKLCIALVGQLYRVLHNLDIQCAATVWVRMYVTLLECATSGNWLVASSYFLSDSGFAEETTDARHGSTVDDFKRRILEARIRVVENLVKYFPESASQMVSRPIDILSSSPPPTRCVSFSQSETPLRMKFPPTDEDPHTSGSVVGPLTEFIWKVLRGSSSGCPWCRLQVFSNHTESSIPADVLTTFLQMVDLIRALGQSLQWQTRGTQAEQPFFDFLMDIAAPFISSPVVWIIILKSSQVPMVGRMCQLIGSILTQIRVDATRNPFRSSTTCHLTQYGRIIDLDRVWEQVDSSSEQAVHLAIYIIVQSTTFLASLTISLDRPKAVIQHVLSMFSALTAFGAPGPTALTKFWWTQTRHVADLRDLRTDYALYLCRDDGTYRYCGACNGFKASPYVPPAVAIQALRSTNREHAVHKTFLQQFSSYVLWLLCQSAGARYPQDLGRWLCRMEEGPHAEQKTSEQIVYRVIQLALLIT